MCTPGPTSNSQRHPSEGSGSGSSDIPKASHYTLLHPLSLSQRTASPSSLGFCGKINIAHYRRQPQVAILHARPGLAVEMEGKPCHHRTGHQAAESMSLLTDKGQREADLLLGMNALGFSKMEWEMAGIKAKQANKH